jgi:hypothetical protein
MGIIQGSKGPVWCRVHRRQNLPRGAPIPLRVTHVMLPRMLVVKTPQTALCRNREECSCLN